MRKSTYINEETDLHKDDAHYPMQGTLRFPVYVLPSGRETDQGQICMAPNRSCHLAALPPHCTPRTRLYRWSYRRPGDYRQGYGGEVYHWRRGATFPVRHFLQLACRPPMPPMGWWTA